MKKEKTLYLLEKRILKAMADAKGLGIVASFDVSDKSVQTEIRMSASWSIKVAVDEIHYPKDLSGINSELWGQMGTLVQEIRETSNIKRDSRGLTESINGRTKAGSARMYELKLNWNIETGRAFMSDYRHVISVRSLNKARAAIAKLQAQQKALLPQLRASNADYLAKRKEAKTEQDRINSEAVESGQFWKADKKFLKLYFHPPFSKNFLADVSEKWRAALFLECKSVSYKLNNGVWGHKLAGTESGYLCGIDDNGDEWGHQVHVCQGVTDYGDNILEGTVEDAMEWLFQISKASLLQSVRQGDLLFCPEEIPDETELHPQEKWTPRESHDITSPSLKRNGRYFCADHEIAVNHTSHAQVILPAGEYRLYMSTDADAD